MIAVFILLEKLRRDKIRVKTWLFFTDDKTKKYCYLIILSKICFRKLEIVKVLLGKGAHCKSRVLSCYFVF